MSSPASPASALHDPAHTSLPAKGDTAAAAVAEADRKRQQWLQHKVRALARPVVQKLDITPEEVAQADAAVAACVAASERAAVEGEAVRERLQQLLSTFTVPTDQGEEGEGAGRMEGEEMGGGGGRKRQR
jgi:ubiquinone biosynthesis protein UbiJ